MANACGTEVKLNMRVCVCVRVCMYGKGIACVYCACVGESVCVGQPCMETERGSQYSMSACNFPFGLGRHVCACLCRFLFQAVCLGTPAKDECA